jgi:hypothetical protein
MVLAVATADIEPSKAFWSVEPVEKRFAHKTAPTTHQPLVSLSISEKLSFAHVDQLQCMGILVSFELGDA